MPTTAHSSQLCPNNWVPVRPGGSRCVSRPHLGRTHEQQKMGPSWTDREGTKLPHLPDSAEVVGSITDKNLWRVPTGPLGWHSVGATFSRTACCRVSKSSPGQPGLAPFESLDPVDVPDCACCVPSA
jgi:hypothetical protein